MLAVLPMRGIRFVPRLPGARGPTSLMRTRGKPVKEEKIKSASPSALVSADPPERACGITILPIKQQDPGQPPERDLPLTERGSGQLEKGETRRERKVSGIRRLNGGS